MQAKPLATTRAETLDQALHQLLLLFVRSAVVGAMASMRDQALAAGNQSVLLTGHQGKPPVVKHSLVRDRQSALQQRSIAEDRASRDLVPLSKTHQRAMLWIRLVPLPERAA